MNVVTFNSASLVNPAFLDKEAKNVIKLWAYFGSMGIQLTTSETMYRTSPNQIVNALVATGNLNFSVSNISFSPDAKKPSAGANDKVLDVPPLVQESFYDTRFQGVREWLEEPYPVTGYQVYILADSLESSNWNIQDDMDDYIRVKLLDIYEGGSFVKSVDLWIGTSKAGLTDFYVPFEGIPKSKITYLNPQKIAKHLGGISTVGGSVISTVPATKVGGITSSQLEKLRRMSVPNSNLQRDNLNDFVRF